MGAVTSFSGDDVINSKVSAKMAKLKQGNLRMVEFQHWYISYQGTVSIHKYGTLVDIECIRQNLLTAVLRAVNGPGTEVDTAH